MFWGHLVQTLTCFLAQKGLTLKFKSACVSLIISQSWITPVQDFEQQSAKK